jgi:hypothetical protein
MLEDLNLASRLFVARYFARKRRMVLHIAKSSFLQTFAPTCSFRVITVIKTAAGPSGLLVEGECKWGSVCHAGVGRK